MKKLFIYLSLLLTISVTAQGRISAPLTDSTLIDSTTFVVKENNRTYSTRLDSIRNYLKTYFDGFYTGDISDGVVQSVSFANNLLTFSGTSGAFNGSVDMSALSPEIDNTIQVVTINSSTANLSTSNIENFDYFLIDESQTDVTLTIEATDNPGGMLFINIYHEGTGNITIQPDTGVTFSTQTFTNTKRVILYSDTDDVWKVLNLGDGVSNDDLDDVVQRGNGTTSSIITRGLTIQQNDLVLDSFTGMYELTLVNPTGHSANHTQTFADADGIHEVYVGEYNATTNTPTLSNASLNEGAYYKVTTAGTQDFGNGSISFGVGDYVGCDDTEWFKKVDNNQSVSGVETISWQTEISTNTTFSGTQKGLNTIYPFNSTSSLVATIDKGTYTIGDVINFNRRGSGSVEIVRGTDVRLNGVRNQDNKFFINNIGSNAFIQFSHLDGSTLVGNVIGNITGGYEGAVIATNYSELREGDTGVNLTITGSGLSNATVSFSTGVTLNSIVSTSNNEMVVNVDVTALENETVTPTFDNGDITIDTDAITIAAAAPTLPSYADYVAWYKFENTTPSDETGNHNGTNNGATVITGQVNNGYAFDGVNDYVSGLTDLGITDVPCTFDFWVRVSDVSGLKWFVTNNDQFNYKGIFPYISDAKFGIQFGDGAGTGSTDRKNFVSTNDVITINTWHHISVIITDINTITLKVDNVTQAIPFSSGTASSVSFTGIDYQFGRKVFNSTLYYSVDLDELKVYDRALTSTEQTDIHTLESAGNPMISN